MILDGYENNSAYADKDRAFVHLNPDEYVLEDTEKRRNMEAENEQRKKKSTQEEEKPDIEYVPQGKGGYIRISPNSNFRVLPLFYALPQKLVKQRPSYLLNCPTSLSTRKALFYQIKTG